MRSIRVLSTVAAAILAVGALSACSADESVDEHAGHHGTEETPAHADRHADHSSGGEHDHAEMDMDHEHSPDGGPAPEGIEPASDPLYPVGSQVILHTDHMPGMDGASATITGAFTTTTYAVDYTPTDGGAPVKDHKWVVQEELVDPPAAPVADGAAVTIGADHMSGMQGAEGTVARSTEETVYMVDFEMDGKEMTNHKWVVESEISPA